VARFSGDEFAMVALNIDVPEDASSAAGAIIRILRDGGELRPFVPTEIVA
jgi:hypothetical protein